MSCPYFKEQTRSLCTAVDGLLHPSLFEEKRFCRGENYVECCIYKLIIKSAQSVSRFHYAEIENQQYENKRDCCLAQAAK